MNIFFPCSEEHQRTWGRELQQGGSGEDCCGDDQEGVASAVAQLTGGAGSDVPNRSKFTGQRSRYRLKYKFADNSFWMGCWWIGIKRMSWNNALLTNIVRILLFKCADNFSMIPDVGNGIQISACLLIESIH